MSKTVKQILAQIILWSFVILPLAVGHFLPSEAAANVGWACLVILCIIAAVVTISFLCMRAGLDHDDNTEALVVAVDYYQIHSKRSGFKTAWVWFVSLLTVALAAINGFTTLAVVYAVLELAMWLSALLLAKAAEPHAKHWGVSDGVLYPKNQRKADPLDSLMRQATKKPEPSRPAPTVRATDTGSMTDPLNPLSPISPLHPLNQLDSDCDSRRGRYEPTPSYSHSHSDSGSFSSSSSSSDSGSSSSCSGGCGGSD